ncbi:hypothetical protein ANO14919_094060 [Xylariales sp. No.14919]|nr:hypothetical protein ANO14919_094060 [Xylariales sp. No.14919]
MHLRASQLRLLRSDSSGTSKDESSIESAATAAYCPREQWTINQSIRSNILLDISFDSSLYEQALGAVQLDPDLHR